MMDQIRNTNIPPQRWRAGEIPARTTDVKRGSVRSVGRNKYEARNPKRVFHQTWHLNLSASIFGFVSNFDIRISCLLLCFLLSCSEPFPTYMPPENVLEGSIEVVSPDTVIVFLTQAGYFVNSPLILNVNLTNIHDDLLSGPAKVEGLVTVQSFSEIPRTMIITLTTGNLLGPPVFQGDISLPPGSSATFSTLWTPFAVDGSIVFEGLPFVEANGKKYYGPITFLPNAEVQIFDQVQPIRFEGAQFILVFEETTEG